MLRSSSKNCENWNGALITTVITCIVTWKRAADNDSKSLHINEEDGTLCSKWRELLKVNQTPSICSIGLSWNHWRIPGANPTSSLFQLHLGGHRSKIIDEKMLENHDNIQGGILQKCFQLWQGYAPWPQALPLDPTGAKLPSQTHIIGSPFSQPMDPPVSIITVVTVVVIVYCQWRREVE